MANVSLIKYEEEFLNRILQKARLLPVSPTSTNKGLCLCIFFFILHYGLGLAAVTDVFNIFQFLMRRADIPFI